MPAVDCRPGADFITGFEGQDKRCSRCRFDSLIGEGPFEISLQHEILVRVIEGLDGNCCAFRVGRKSNRVHHAVLGHGRRRQ